VNLWQGLCFCSVILYSFLMGFARLYVRVHSWNQVMFGWTLGFWIAFYFHFMVRDHLITHVDAITLTPRLPENRRNKYAIIASSIGAAVIAILVACYMISRQQNPQHIWAWTFMIVDKCPSKKGGHFFADSSIMQAGLCLLPITGYLGILFHRVK
jgi:PAP2 superfamily